MLFDHQRAGAEWLAQRQRAYLADRPGMGKTRTLIHGLRLAGAKRPLIVCPAIVRSHWQNEFKAVDYGTELIFPSAAPMLDSVAVCSYDEINNGGQGLMARFIFRDRIDALVLDEAHYTKNAEASRTRLLLGRNGYARRIMRVWLASGTPIPKHPDEIAPVLLSCFPEVALAHGLNTIRDVRERFCVMTRRRIGLGRWADKVTDVQNTDELHAILSEIMLRRAPGDDVPPIWWQTVVLDADIAEETRSAFFYQGCLSDLRDTPELARLRRLIGEAKAPAVVQLLRSQLEGTTEKVVVFAHHRSVLEILREGLSSFGLVYVDGDTSQKARDVNIDLFQTDSRCRVFLGQQKACQEGITLTAANRVVLVEPSWTATDNVQAASRVARYGQKESHCIAQMIALAGTLDESIVRQNKRETEMVAQSLAGVDKAGA